MLYLKLLVAISQFWCIICQWMTVPQTCAFTLPIEQEPRGHFGVPSIKSLLISLIKGRTQIYEDTPHPHVSTPTKNNTMVDEVLVIPTLRFTEYGLSGILSHDSRCQDSSIDERRRKGRMYKNQIISLHQQYGNLVSGFHWFSGSWKLGKPRMGIYTTNSKG